METKPHDGDITPGTNSYYGDYPDLEIASKKPARPWGAGGQRWDEECQKCRRETVIDNDTELCERCS